MHKVLLCDAPFLSSSSHFMFSFPNYYDFCRSADPFLFPTFQFGIVSFVIIHFFPLILANFISISGCMWIFFRSFMHAMRVYAILSRTKIYTFFAVALSSTGMNNQLFVWSVARKWSRRVYKHRILLKEKISSKLAKSSVDAKIH